MLKPLLLAAALTGATLAAAHAQDDGPRRDRFGDATIARADAQAKAAQEFTRLDADHDGSLSDSELSAMFPPGPMRDMSGMMARTADTDGDGRISRDEFTAAALHRFDRLDANHDGQLTKAERDAAHGEHRLHRPTGPEGMDGGPGTPDRPMGRDDGVPMPPPPDDDGQ